MTRIIWGEVGTRYFESGLDRGVLYVEELPGVPWNGLISVDEVPTGGEPKVYYLDGEPYLMLSMTEDFTGTINAFYSPVEFDGCDGVLELQPGLSAYQQPKRTFGLSYRNFIGNDVDGSEHAYKIHLIYEALASPSTRNRNTLNESPETAPLSWSITTKPQIVPNGQPSAHLIVDTSKIPQEYVDQIESILYGSDTLPARLPSPTELSAIFDMFNDFFMVDNGDGTFTITGSETAVQMLDGTTFQLTSEEDQITILDEDTYTISSY